MKSCFVLRADESQIQEKNYTTANNNDKKIVLTANCKNCSYVICFLVSTHFFFCFLEYLQHGTRGIN